MGTLGQLAVRIMRGKSYPQTIEYLIWGGAFITTVLLLVVLGRIARGAIQTPPEERSSRIQKDRLEPGVLSG
jgi:hypothetical protein